MQFLSSPFQPSMADHCHTEVLGSRPSPAHEDDTRLTYGGGVAYWDNRFSEDAADGETFDWLFDYASLRGFLREYIPQHADVLQVGCGNSDLAVEWCKDGHTGGLVNVDNSAYVIDMLRAQQDDSLPNLRYVLGDVRCLSEDDFPSESFDAVLDKATFDCIACNPENQKDLEDMLLSIFRVLRPGGVYLLISCGDPESRLCWLDDQPGLEWSVSARHMAIRSDSDTEACHHASKPTRKRREVFASEEVMLTSNDDWETQLGELVEDEHTFVYLCRKSDRAV
mmetsp:Transcript_93263/g.237264  ORF Transcript_93263/g.237264 Transcript_93263/m.237264 type:complete len:281 (-) Transcript_93263:64-906(-)